MIIPGGPRIDGHRDLADLIRQQITTGELPPGHALPSERQLRETYGLGKHAVRDALHLLRHEGLIDVRKGYGAVVRAQPDRHEVTLPAGARLTARMPTPAEREQLGIGLGVPVLHVVNADGSGDLFPADRVTIVRD